MSTAIRDVAVSIPSLRLAASAYTGAWGGNAARGLRRKPFCAFDEDAVSLAVEAAHAVVARAGEATPIGAIYLGATTLPYEEKPSVATVATALFGHRNIRTVELRGSPQAGLQAIVLAAEYCAVHPGRMALAIAADAPQAAPHTAIEHALAAAGAAFLLGPGPGLAEIGDSAAVTIETFGARFRRAGETNLSDLELRTSDPRKAVAALAADFKPGTIAHLATGGTPDVAAALAKAFGGAADELWANLGDVGAAAAPLALAHMIETAKAGEKILAVAVGSGATALTLTRTAQPAPASPKVVAQLSAGTEVDYVAYLKHRHLLGGPVAR